jgi:hypothetical protein
LQSDELTDNGSLVLVSCDAANYDRIAGHRQRGGRHFVVD